MHTIVPIARTVHVPSTRHLEDTLAGKISLDLAKNIQYYFIENSLTRIFVILLYFLGAISLVLGLTGMVPLWGYGTVCILPYDLMWFSLFSWPLLKRVVFEVDFIIMIILNLIALAAFISSAPANSSRILAAFMYCINSCINIGSDARPFDLPGRGKHILNLYGYMFQVVWFLQAFVCQIHLCMFYFGMYQVENLIVFNLAAMEVTNVSVGIVANQAFTAMKWRYLIVMILQLSSEGGVHPVLILRQTIVFHYITDEDTIGSLRAMNGDNEVLDEHDLKQTSGKIRNDGDDRRRSSTIGVLLNAATNGSSSNKNIVISERQIKQQQNLNNGNTSTKQGIVGTESI
jgi:hypothetical protein